MVRSLLLALRYPEGSKRRRGYNEDSQSISTGHQGQRPAEPRTRYTYDGDGNMATQTDPDDNKTIYTYNGNNELTKVEEPNKTITETATTAPAR
jgi:YD repeat-containing protein